jgi:hypothetical protein
MSKVVGGILFILVLIIVVFGVVSFSAEFFFGRPLMAFIRDFIFVVFKK